MIPIFLIAAVINVLLSTAIVIRLRSSFQNNEKATANKLFILFYEFFGCAWVAWTLVYLVDDPYGKNALDIVGYFLLIFSTAFIVQVPLLLRQKRAAAFFFSILELLIALIYALGRVMYFHPMALATTAPFYMWIPTEENQLIYLLGISTVPGAIAISVTFYIMGKNASSQIRKKSVYLALGKFVLLLAAIIAFFIVPYQNTLLVYTLAAFLVSTSLLLTFFTIKHFQVTS
ncbi:MAG: hypothetical protein WC052_03605 [Patescibacteria group bacterium]